MLITRYCLRGIWQLGVMLGYRQVKPCYLALYLRQSGLPKYFNSTTLIKPTLLRQKNYRSSCTPLPTSPHI